MGRSYSFHPMHSQQPELGVQGSGPRLANDEDVQKLAQQKSDLPESGKPGVSETVSRYQERAEQKRQADGESADDKA